MTGTRDYSWLPEHQWHVAETLGHVDDLFARVGDHLLAYSRSGSLKLANIADGARAYVVVEAIEAVPAALGRFAADAMTQLRAALEHTIFAEVEFLTGRRLTKDEAQRIEMPAHVTEVDFDAWVKGRRKLGLPALQTGSQLLHRMRDLQPFQRRRDIQGHPMFVLADHTNFAKHRAPIVALSKLGTVRPDVPAPDLTFASEGDRPLAPGDVLASGPKYQRVPIGIWPSMCIQRPKGGAWHEVMRELGRLEEWVRTVAIPVLITGRCDQTPLPPGLDITRGHRDMAKALAMAGQMPAVGRFFKRLKAATAREEIAEVLALHESAVDREVIAAWADSLDDDRLLAVVHGLARASGRNDLRAVDQQARLLIDEAVRALRAVTADDVPASG